MSSKAAEAEAAEATVPDLGYPVQEVKIMPRREAQRIEDLSPEVRKLYDVLNKESDLSAALVAASFLDDTLHALLAKRLVDDKVVHQALQKDVMSTLELRSQLALGLGLISNGLFRNIDLVRRIRNDFAHGRLLLTFESEQIAAKCRNLKMPEFKEVVSVGSDDPIRSPGSLSPRNPRSRFELVVALMIQALLVSGLGVDRLPMRSDEWDRS